MKLINLAVVKNIYIACGYTDMRMSINGLAGYVQQHYKQNPAGGSLYLFCGRRRDRFKALFWDDDGYVLLYKRLEEYRYQWPTRPEDVRRITIQQFRWLMEGLAIEQKTAISPTIPGRVV
jgi:transposase